MLSRTETLSSGVSPSINRTGVHIPEPWQAQKAQERLADPSTDVQSSSCPHCGRSFGVRIAVVSHLRTSTSLSCFLVSIFLSPFLLSIDCAHFRFRRGNIIIIILLWFNESLESDIKYMIYCIRDCIRVYPMILMFSWPPPFVLWTMLTVKSANIVPREKTGFTYSTLLLPSTVAPRM